jgi:VWFA-related protein
MVDRGLAMLRRVPLRVIGSAVAPIVIALATAAVTAQDRPPQEPVFRTRVDLVQVEVVVVDSRGQPVRGLTQSAFTLLDRKTPQPITAFEEVTRASQPLAESRSAPTVAADVADNTSVSTGRLIVLVIDDLHLDRVREARARALAIDVIKRLGPGASMSVLFTSGNHSTELIADPPALIAAASTLKAFRPIRRPAEVSEVVKTTTDLEKFFSGIQTFETIEDAARMLASNETARKAFVVISEGINKDLTGMFDGNATPCELAAPMSPCYASVALRRMMEDVRRSNVTIYVLDPRGHVAEGDLLQENLPTPGRDPDSPLRWKNPVRRAQDGATITAEASGGFAVTDTDDFNGGLDRIQSDLDHYYVLGFYPTDPTSNDFRRLDVTVPGHPDWTLRFRKGYVPKDDANVPKNADPLVSGALAKPGLSLRLGALPWPVAQAGATKTARLAVVLEVSAARAALVDAGGLINDGVSYEVVLVDMKQGKATSQLTRETKLALKPVEPAPASSLVSYQLPVTVTVPPGRYQLRASATSTKAAQSGSVYLSVDVPDFPAEALALSGVAVGYADGPHVAVASSGTAEEDLGLPFVPTLDRTFSRADTLRLFASVTRSTVIPASVTASILDGSGGLVWSVRKELGASPSGDFDASLPLAAVASGAYTLRVTATDGRHTTARELALVVR